MSATEPNDPLFDKVMEYKNTPAFRLRSQIKSYLDHTIENATEEQLELFAGSPELAMVEMMQYADGASLSEIFASLLYRAGVDLEGAGRAVPGCHTPRGVGSGRTG